MSRKQNRDPAGRAGAELVAQQVAGLGGPVGQGYRGQFDALAGGVVVVGDARADRVGAQHRVQNRPAERGQLMHSGLSEPAVRTGDGRGRVGRTGLDARAGVT